MHSSYGVAEKDDCFEFHHFIDVNSVKHLLEPPVKTLDQQCPVDSALLSLGTALQDSQIVTSVPHVAFIALLVQ